MPGIGRCHVNDRLPMAIASTPNVIMKVIMFIDVAHLDLPNREAQPIANVVRRLRTRARAVAHEDSHELSGARTLSESNQFIAAVTVMNTSVREWLPVVVIVGVQMHWVVA